MSNPFQQLVTLKIICIAEYYYWLKAARQNKQSKTFLSESTVIDFRNAALSAIRQRLVAEEPDHCLFDLEKYS